MNQKYGLPVEDDRIPDEAHLMRFVAYTNQIRDPDTDAFLGIIGAAFYLRESDKGHLSLTWVEHYGSKCIETYGIAASAYRDTLRSKKVPSKGCFAVGNAGVTRDTAKSHRKDIRIVHAPDGPNTGHVELRKFTDEDLSLLDALSQAFGEHVQVSSLQFVPEGSYGPAR